MVVSRLGIFMTSGKCLWASQLLSSIMVSVAMLSSGIPVLPGNFYETNDG